jgi:endoglycosylceramidase
MRAVFLAVALAVLSCGGGPQPSAPQCEVDVCVDLTTLRLTLDGHRFVDAQGREVLLRGVNAGGRSKFHPFFPFEFSESGLPEQADAPPFEEAAQAYVGNIAAWGFDVARVPFTWEALEPTRGTYDTTFLGRYRRLAEIMGEHGIRVIVDFHQDVFAWPYCGDGFPLWACPEPVPERPDDCSGWFMGYMGDEDVQAAFDRFWANEDGLRDDFAAMWRSMAAELWQVDAVVGFEIINEPYKGTMASEVWGPDVMTPFYEEVAAAIREEAPGALVFFDSTGTDAINTSTDIARPAGGFFVFAPHYYNATAFLADIVDTPRPSDMEVEIYLTRWAELNDVWDLPVLVGEFGIAPAVPWAREYVRSNYDAFDALLLHATLWEYSTTSDDWNDESMSVIAADGSETDVLDAAIRPYPASVAGTLASVEYDDASRKAVIVYEATAGGVSQIAVPGRLYPGGPHVRIQGVSGCVSTCEPGVLTVHAAGAGTATVTLRPD